MTGPELDEATKVRIEAEEAYRAEIRSKRPKSVNKGRQNLILLAILAGLGFLYWLTHASWVVTLTPMP